MAEHLRARLQGALLAAMLLLGLWAWRELPAGAQVPIHFDAQGRANGWAGPLQGLFGLPLIALVLWGAQALQMRAASRGGAQARLARGMAWLLSALIALLALVHCVIVGAALGGWTPQAWLGLLPASGLLLATAGVLHRGLDPTQPELAPSAVAVRRLRAISLATVGVAWASMIATALGSGPEALLHKLPLLLAGSIFVLTGNVLGKMRPNGVAGIRTPWTLRHPRVWEQTHRWGGKRMVLAGVLLLALIAVPLDAAAQAGATVCMGLALSAAAMWKSRQLWQALPPEERQRAATRG